VIGDQPGKDEQPPGGSPGGKGNSGQVRSRLPFDAPYRSVYLPVLRDLLPEAYSTFDFPQPTQIKGQRDVTTVAPQALWFMNSDFATELATTAAQDLSSVEAAYRAILSRPPSPEETTEAQALDHPTLIQALFATAEFRYVF
jgi:hypothetical protein